MKKFSKVLLTLSLPFVMAVSLTGCTDAEGSKTTPDTKQSQIVKKSEEAEKAAAEKAAAEKAAAEQAAAEKAAAEQAAAEQAASMNRIEDSGQIYTKDQGAIIGNSKSKIYHLPGQAGYHMNSSNAVYFDSEEQAIAAGYRKSKR
ncbi:hypothetical protein [Lactococcus garvieae]|uniref:sunset domain-containing protein n=1 Tax=Lactococcus garvieae TaxID=1363 RepID=UPI0031331820